MEKEFYIQLFVKHDPTLKLPTVGELLKRMFKEQQTLFEKVLYLVTCMVSTQVPFSVGYVHEFEFLLYTSSFMILKSCNHKACEIRLHACFRINYYTGVMY